MSWLDLLNILKGIQERNPDVLEYGAILYDPIIGNIDVDLSMSMSDMNIFLIALKPEAEDGK